MNEREARSLLGILPEDDSAQIKAKYRKLMHIYHPDAAGAEDEEILEKAKQINEAFRVLKKASVRAAAEGGRSRSSRHHTVFVRQNRSAIHARVLYIANLLGEEIAPVRVAEGKFYWDPDVEEFRLFLISINQLCTELLRYSEEKFGYYSREELPEPRVQDQCRRKLFHLLTQEFIDPLECLVNLCEKAEEKAAGKNGAAADRSGGYHVEGTVACTVGRAGASAQELRYWTNIAPGDPVKVEIRDSRLWVYAPDGYCFGHVFFDEDSYYYIVIPLIQQEIVKADVSVKRKLGMERAAAGKAMLILDLVLTPVGKKYPNPSQAINREIAELLNKYEKRLRHPGRR